jgi:hypothetical protein
VRRMQAVASGPQQQVSVSALQHAGQRPGLHSAMAAQVMQAARRTPGTWRNARGA